MDLNIEEWVRYINMFPYVIFGVFVLIAICIYHFRNKKVQSILEEQAQRFNGTVTPATLLNAPKLIFHDQDLEVQVWTRPGSRNSPPMTFFKVQLPHLHNYTLKVFKEGLFNKVGKMFGVKDLQLNNPSFDQFFVLQGKDESFVMNVLSISVQSHLLELLALNPTLKLNNGILQLHVVHELKTSEEYDRLIKAGLVVLQRIREIT